MRKYRRIQRELRVRPPGTHALSAAGCQRIDRPYHIDVALSFIKSDGTLQNIVVPGNIKFGRTQWNLNNYDTRTRFKETIQYRPSPITANTNCSMPYSIFTKSLEHPRLQLIGNHILSHVCVGSCLPSDFHVSNR